MALIGVPDHDAGAASALINASLQIGGALGAAVFTTVYASGKSSYLQDNPARSMFTAFSAEVSGYTNVFALAAIFVALVTPVVFFLVRAKKDDLPTDAAVPVG